MKRWMRDWIYLCVNILCFVVILQLLLFSVHVFVDFLQICYPRGVRENKLIWLDLTWRDLLAMARLHRLWFGLVMLWLSGFIRYRSQNINNVYSCKKLNLERLNFLFFCLIPIATHRVASPEESQLRQQCYPVSLNPYAVFVCDHATRLWGLLFYDRWVFDL